MRLKSTQYCVHSLYPNASDLPTVRVRRNPFLNLTSPLEISWKKGYTLDRSCTWLNSCHRFHFSNRFLKGYITEELSNTPKPASHERVYRSDCNNFNQELIMSLTQKPLNQIYWLIKCRGHPGTKVTIFAQGTLKVQQQYSLNRLYCKVHAILKCWKQHICIIKKENGFSWWVVLVYLKDMFLWFAGENKSSLINHVTGFVCSPFYLLPEMKVLEPDSLGSCCCTTQ